MEVSQFIYYFGSAVLLSITVVLWITSQLAKLKEYISKQTDKVVSKLEYHEHHDDDRFSQLNADLVAIKLRNASKDVMMQDILDDIKKVMNGSKAKE